MFRAFRVVDGRGILPPSTIHLDFLCFLLGIQDHSCSLRGTTIDSQDVTWEQWSSDMQSPKP